MQILTTAKSKEYLLLKLFIHFSCDIQFIIHMRDNIMMAIVYFRIQFHYLN